MSSLSSERSPNPVLRLLICAAVFCKGALAVYNDSIFSFENSYPTVWWAVSASDRPTLANNAVRLRSDTYDSNLFARSIIVSLAAGERNEVAKSVGYMINANSTFGGGCPVPPPPKGDLLRFGNSFAAAILAADNQTALWGTSLQTAAQQLNTTNVTAATLANISGATVSDMFLGALFVAGRTCGPPNALTSSLQSSVIAKYLNGTCFYVGPILQQLTLNSTRDIDAFNRTYSADLRLANSTDPYVTSPVLTAYNECLYGPSSLQNPPSWLYYSFGPTVSIDGPSNPLQTSSLNLTGVTLGDKLKGFDTVRGPAPGPSAAAKKPSPPPQKSPAPAPRAASETTKSPAPAARSPSPAAVASPVPTSLAIDASQSSAGTLSFQAGR